MEKKGKKYIADLQSEREREGERGRERGREERDKRELKRGQREKWKDSTKTIHEKMIQTNNKIYIIRERYTHNKLNTHTYVRTYMYIQRDVRHH